MYTSSLITVLISMDLCLSKPALVSELSALLPYMYNQASSHPVCVNSLRPCHYAFVFLIFQIYSPCLIILKPQLFHHPHLPTHQLAFNNLLPCTVHYLIEHLPYFSDISIIVTDVLYIRKPGFGGIMLVAQGHTGN